MTVMMKLITLKLKFCDKVTISSQLIEITKKLTGKNFKRICSLMDVFWIVESATSALLLKRHESNTKPPTILFMTRLKESYKKMQIFQDYYIYR